MAIGTTHFFLRSKITLPAIRSDLVPRQRLLAQMQIGMQHGLTLVGAPAGFGKTTLVSTWAQQCGYPVSWVSLDINDNDPVVFWIYVVTALQEMHPEIGKTALALLQSPQPTSLERILTVLLNELSTHMEEAHGYLLEGHAQSHMANNLISVLLATILLTDIEVMQGRLQDAAHVYQEVLQQAGSWPLWQVVEAHIALGSLFLEWNQLDDAAQHLRQAIALGKETLREIYLAPGYIILAQVMQARREYEQAQELLARAIEMAQKLGHDRARRWAMAEQARMALAQENWSAIDQWISTVGITLAAEPSYEREVEYLMLARVGIAQQHSSEVLPLLEHMLGKDEEAERVHNVIAILVLQAKAYGQAKRIIEAIKTLERAVTLAEPAGYVRVFVNEGPSLQALLAKMLSAKENAPQAGYITQLLTTFPESLSAQRTEKVATKPITTPVEVLLEPLSGREQEVLELLAAGMANQKIAERLVVTVGTVKTHIKSIYGKLGVHRRTQAIVRARELGLL